MLSIHAVQLDIAWHDKPTNHAAVEALLARRSIAAGDLVVLPEMFDVGFTMDARTAVDVSTADTAAFLSNLARRFGVAVTAGFATLDADGRPVNQCSTFGPSGELLHRYVKCQPFTPAGEHLAYAAGDGPSVFEYGGITFAPLICYDLRFPELFRAAAKQGAEAFLVIANWPAPRAEHRAVLARARAIENQAYVLALNRCGKDPKHAYDGDSLIVDPKGTVIARAGDAAEVLSATVDASVVRDWRRDFPALRDARFW